MTKFDTSIQEGLLDDSVRVVIVMPYDGRQAVLQSQGKSLDRKVEITGMANKDQGL
jgi:predicted nuclease with RNAse H fold